MWAECDGSRPLTESRDLIVGGHKTWKETAEVGLVSVTYPRPISSPSASERATRGKPRAFTPHARAALHVFRSGTPDALCDVARTRHGRFYIGCDQARGASPALRIYVGAASGNRCRAVTADHALNAHHHNQASHASMKPRFIAIICARQTVLIDRDQCLVRTNHVQMGGTSERALPCPRQSIASITRSGSEKRRIALRGHRTGQPLQSIGKWPVCTRTCWPRTTRRRSGARNDYARCAQS